MSMLINTSEYIEKKSRFIGHLFEIESIEEIESILHNLKIEHKRCTHICYSYILNTNGNYEKCFDDGEPSGTAGKPILNVLKRKELKNNLIVVVRYFGGIKLGAGGLLRAYSKTSSLLFEN